MKTNDSTLLAVLENSGCMSEEQAKALAVTFPEMLACAKMARSSRFCVPMRELVDTIRNRMQADPLEYAREVYLPADLWDSLCASLGVKKPY